MPWWLDPKSVERSSCLCNSWCLTHNSLWTSLHSFPVVLALRDISSNSALYFISQHVSYHSAPGHVFMFLFMALIFTVRSDVRSDPWFWYQQYLRSDWHWPLGFVFGYFFQEGPPPICCHHVYLLCLDHMPGHLRYSLIPPFASDYSLCFCYCMV